MARLAVAGSEILTMDPASSQERLSALDLESKHDAVERAEAALEAEKRRLDRLTADAEEAQARAADLNTQVQQKVRYNEDGVA